MQGQSLKDIYNLCLKCNIEYNKQYLALKWNCEITSQWIKLRKKLKGYYINSQKSWEFIALASVTSKQCIYERLFSAKDSDTFGALVSTTVAGW